MQMNIFETIEDVEEFFDGLNYDECWDAVNAYGDMDEERASWEKSIKTQAHQDDALVALRRLAIDHYLKAHPLKYRHIFEETDKTGMTYEEVEALFKKDPSIVYRCPSTWRT